MVLPVSVMLVMRQGVSAPNSETVIIGGGPAGAGAAIKLARAERPVCLLERKESSHHKICGEFISGEAARYLTELGIDLINLGAQPLYNVRLYHGRDCVQCTLPFTGWSLSRLRLDAALLQQAKTEGAQVRTGVSVRSLEPENQGWCISARHCGGERETLWANTVFLASGKHDLRNWPRATRRPPPLFIGLKMHLNLARVQRERLQKTVELHLFQGGYAGLEPVEEGGANLCMLIHKSAYDACGRHWSGVLEWLCGQSPHLSTRLTGAYSLWPRPLAIYGTPFGYLYQSRAKPPSGLFRLGDQMAVIPSLAGDGIAIALRSALLAADNFKKGRGAERYHRQAYQHFQNPLRHADFLATLCSYRLGRSTALWLVRWFPWLLDKAVQTTRVETLK